MKYDALFDSKLSSVLLQRLKFNFLSASLQWHIPPCTPSHTVFVLGAPLPFPQSLLLNYTLKCIKYYIYIVQTSIASISASSKPLARRRLSVCLSPTHRCTHRRTYLLWFQPLTRFEMWIPFQSSPFDHPVIFSPLYQSWHIYSSPCFTATFSRSCPHLLWLRSSVCITTPVFL